MIAIAHDPPSFSLVVIESRPASSDAELQSAVDAVTKLGHESKEAKRTATFLMIVDKDVPAPSAEWRRRFAEAEAVFANLDMVFVTQSALARGVITAVRWMAGSRPGVTHQTQETFARALAALEKQSGKPLPGLVALHDACRKQLADGRRRAS